MRGTALRGLSGIALTSGFPGTINSGLLIVTVL
jgi:hypothetical protein